MTGQPLTPPRAGVTAEDHLIDGRGDGVQLFLRNKRPVEQDAIGSMVLLHGATFSSISLFDVDVDGASFMDVLALAGIDAWALDIRGYGGSTRPVAMRKPPSSDAALVRAVEAADDVADALSHVRSVRPSAPLGLLGMSWGGSLAGVHASRHNDLDALVLVAPLWLSTAPLRFDGGAPIMTHRIVDVDAYEAAWLAAAPDERRNELLPDGWFDRWAAVTAATDVEAPLRHIRAPSGAVADVREHWTVAKPLYDPAMITTPTLVMRGTWDVDVRRDMALDLFDRLTAAPDRNYIEIANSTHMMLMEPARRIAFAQITAFLANCFGD